MITCRVDSEHRHAIQLISKRGSAPRGQNRKCWEHPALKEVRSGGRQSCWMSLCHGSAIPGAESRSKLRRLRSWTMPQVYGIDANRSPENTSWITQRWWDRYVIKYLFQGWGLSDISKPHAKNSNYNIDQLSSTRHSFPNTNRWIRRKELCRHFEKRFRVGRRLSKFTYEQSSLGSRYLVKMTFRK